MKRLLARSMPALVAMKCRTAGEPVTVAVLGMGLIESGGADDDQRIAQAYADVAADAEPAAIVRDFYLEQVEEHPWMAEPIEPFTALFSDVETQHDAVRTVAEFMATQSFHGCEEMAEADLIGRVVTEMKHMAARRRGAPGYAITLDQAMASVQRETLGRKMIGSVLMMSIDDGYEYLAKVHAAGYWADMWCDSGMRLIGLAAAMREAGLDPETMTWVAMDGDPIKRAIAAVNMAGFAMGENVHVLDGSEYKEALLAAGTTLNGVPITAYGMTPEQARTEKGALIPEEIKDRLEAVMPAGTLPWAPRDAQG